MKVLIVNTSEKTGGAAIAAGRLLDALNSTNSMVDACMLVRDRNSDKNSVYEVKVPAWKKRFHFYWERIVIFTRNHLSKKRLFWVDIANSGIDITCMQVFKDADVIHLHWINQGFLSLSVIDKIMKSGKKVVWTMHDMWPITGVCHHSDDCELFQTHCHDCPLLYNGGSSHDLSFSVFEKKYKKYRIADISFVACSNWLKERAVRSLLTQGHKVYSIPNPIDIQLFSRKEKKAMRSLFSLPEDSKLVLFGALKVTDKRKGIDYLVQACEQLSKQKERIAIVVVGNGADSLKPLFKLPLYSINYVHDQESMVNLYNAVDAFVISSLQENLPNTIMEAMACGTPCVGFDVGGIPEMIDHKKNGYVAKYRDAGDLAEGIKYVLDVANHDSLGHEARLKVERNYAPEVVAAQYLEVYKS